MHIYVKTYCEFKKFNIFISFFKKFETSGDDKNVIALLLFH